MYASYFLAISREVASLVLLWLCYPKILPFKISLQLSDATRLAQPTGLCGIGGKLYIAESESSVIRVASLLDKTLTLAFGGDRVFKENLRCVVESH